MKITLSLVSLVTVSYKLRPLDGDRSLSTTTVIDIEASHAQQRVTGVSLFF